MCYAVIFCLALATISIADPAFSAAQTTEVLSWVRGIERLIIAGFGGLSLVLGWHLFRVGIVPEQAATIENGDWKFHLEKVGPGVFFAFFGAGILIAGLYFNLTLPGPRDGEPNSTSNDVVYLTSGSSEEQQLVRAINTVAQLVPAAEQRDLHEAERRDLKRAVDELKVLRNQLFVRSHGLEALQLWEKHGGTYTVTPGAVPAEDKAVLDEIAPWFTDNLSMGNRP